MSDTPERHADPSRTGRNADAIPARRHSEPSLRQDIEDLSTGVTSATSDTIVPAPGHTSPGSEAVEDPGLAAPSRNPHAAAPTTGPDAAALSAVPSETSSSESTGSSGTEGAPAASAPTASIPPPPADRRALDRRIFSLAWPALGALIAEPLFILIDSAIVGRLGTSELAGLTLASTVLLTLVAVFVFLAYATTAAVARRMGADDQAGAMRMGLDGLWLALGLGLIITAIGIVTAPAIIDLLGGNTLAGTTRQHAIDYLQYSVPGMPGMFVVLAATGALRGLQDTKTPFKVAVIGAALNTAGSFLLVYPAGMGIAGSGLATALTQTGMGLFLAWKVAVGARKVGVALRPHGLGVLSNLRAGLPLLIRTISLRIAVLLTVVVATSLGETTLAAHQIVNAMWGFAAFALDALAIAAQALVGNRLGARDAASARGILRRSVFWGLLLGAAVGGVFAAASWLITPLFNPDPAVQLAAAWGLMVIGIAMPLAGYVFVLDGVLIGAGDGKFLAWAGVVALAMFLPLLWVVWEYAPRGAAGIVWLWVAFGVGYTGARALVNGLRARGERWMRL